MHEEKVYRTELSPVAFLRRNAYVHPNKTAVVHGERRYSYAAFSKRVNRLSSALLAACLEKHDRVAFLAPNIPPLLEAHFAVPAARPRSPISCNTAARACSSSTVSSTRK